LESKLATSGEYKLVIASQVDEWAELAKQANVLIVRDEDVSADVIKSANALSLIIRLLPGQGQVDEETACSRGIELDAIENMGILGVAEHAILLMLSLSKKLPAVHRLTQQSIYADTFTPTVTTQKQYAFNWSGIQGMDVLYRRTLGLVGLGTVGRFVAQRAKAFEMDVAYYDVQRIPVDEESRLGVRFSPLDELLAEADYVSLHTRVLPETEKLINAETLGKMKPTAYLINTARGRLVDEDALYIALRDGGIAGAGLDVFWKEPPERDNPLLGLPNVVLTSHCAGIFNDVAAEYEVDFVLRSIDSVGSS